MFYLLLTTCLAGAICAQHPSPVAYDDLESCFHQAALIAGIDASASGLPYAWRADCSTQTELGLTTVSATGSHGAALAPGYELGAD